MYSQFLDKDPEGKPALQHFNMQFGAPTGLALHGGEAVAEDSSTIWDTNIQQLVGYLHCLACEYQPKITTLQFPSGLNECQINWQEGKTLLLY